MLVADLTQPDQLLEVEAELTENPALDLLINDAGFSGYMPFVELSPDVAEELIRLKCVAVTRLTRAALPGMIARGRGNVINVSSGMSFSGSAPQTPQSVPRATYAAVNGYINVFSEVLNSELTGTGVQIQVLCPAGLDSEFQKQWIKDFRERVGAPPTKAGVNAMSPEQVVQASLASLRLGEVLCMPGLKEPSLLTQYWEAEGKLRAGVVPHTIAERYLE